MSITMLCDSCHDVIDDDAEYFGVDHTRAIPGDGGFGDHDEFGHEDEGLVPIMLRSVVQGHEFHFCSVTCMTTWAMSRTLDEGGVP